MVPVHFDKARAETFLGCLRDGRPVEKAGGGGWNFNDLLSLAGACYFAAMTHGPQTYRAAGIDTAMLPPERREAVEETFQQDLHAAVEFYSELTMLVVDGGYDEHFGPSVKALVGVNDRGPVVNPLEGFRDV